MGGREYPDRPVCGVGVVCFKDDLVLLVGRPAPFAGWSIPGGGQELGETVREAALRELREETGVEARLTGLVDVVDAVRRDASGRVRFHYTLVDFAAEWAAGEPAAGDDALGAEWAPLAEVGRRGLLPETLRVIREAERLRASRPPEADPG